MPTSTVALYAPGLDVMLSQLKSMPTKTASISYSFDPTPIATTTAPDGAIATVWNVKAHEYLSSGKHHTSTIETEQFILNKHYFRSPAYKNSNSTGNVQTECEITLASDESDKKSGKKDKSNKKDSKKGKSDKKDKSHKKSSEKRSKKNDDEMAEAVCVRKHTNKHGHVVAMTHTYKNPQPFATAHVEYTTTASTTSSSATSTASIADATLSAAAEASLAADDNVVIVTKTVGAVAATGAAGTQLRQTSSASANVPKTARIMVASVVVLPALLAFVFA